MCGENQRRIQLTLLLQPNQIQNGASGAVVPQAANFKCKNIFTHCDISKYPYLLNYFYEQNLIYEITLSDLRSIVLVYNHRPL